MGFTYDGESRLSSTSTMPSAVCATTVPFPPSCYTGKERDSETGNDYFLARYYNSNTGRFLSPDWSIKQEPVPYAKLDNPQSLNLYSYVGNNPITRVDADGHCDANGQNCSTWDHVAGAVGGALNIVPATLNLPIKAFNAISGHFGGPQMDELQPIEADAHASSGGMTSGAVASFAVPVGGELKEGAFLAEQVGSMGSRIENILTNGLTEETLSAASREVNGGMSVAKEGGGEFSHVTKVEQHMSGLRRQIAHGKRLLTRPNLGGDVAAEIQGNIDKANAGLDKASEALTPHQ